MIRDFAYIRPKSVEEASTLLRKRDGAAMPLAGGTDLLDLMKGEIAIPAQLVNLKSFSELRRIEYRPGKGLTLGALATLHLIAHDPVVRKRFTALAEAAGRAASPQLRNLATIGGNLCQRPRCWYFRGDFHCLRKGGKTCYAVMGENSRHCIIGGDPCYIVHPSDPAVALLALDASVTILSGKKSRSVPLREFFVLPRRNVHAETILKPGEIITSITVPDPAEGTVSGYLKFSERQSWDFALVSVAAVLTKSDSTRVAEGRENAVSEGLAGFELTPEKAAELSVAALHGALPLEQNEYKVLLAKNLIADLLVRLAT
jgi:xanthine dehydrogenase YagS FAD-binding subunit